MIRSVLLGDSLALLISLHVPLTTVFPSVQEKAVIASRAPTGSYNWIYAVLVTFHHAHAPNTTSAQPRVHAGRRLQVHRTLKYSFGCLSSFALCLCLERCSVSTPLCEHTVCCASGRSKIHEKLMTVIPFK